MQTPPCRNVADITALSGMTGLETRFLGLDLVEAGHLSLMELLEKMTVNPAQSLILMLV